MTSPVETSPPLSSPFARLLADALGDLRGVTASFRDFGHGVEFVYEGRRGDVVVAFRKDGSPSSVMLDDSRGDAPHSPIDGFACVQFAPGDGPVDGFAALLAGYLKDDRAAMIEGLSLVLLARYRPDPRLGLVDLRTGEGTGKVPGDRDSLRAVLSWVVRTARAKIVATFDAEGNPTSFGAVALDDRSPSRGMDAPHDATASTPGMLTAAEISSVTDLLVKFTPGDHAAVRWWPELIWPDRQRPYGEHPGHGSFTRRFAGTLSLPDGSCARGVAGTMYSASQLTADVEIEHEQADAPPLPAGAGRFILAILDGPTVPLEPGLSGRFRLGVGPRDGTD